MEFGPENLHGVSGGIKPWENGVCTLNFEKCVFWDGLVNYLSVQLNASV